MCRPMDRRSCSSCWETVHDAPDGGRGEAHHRGPGVRLAASLFPRRQDHRVSLRPLGLRERVAVRRRRFARARPHEGRKEPLCLAGVDARRAVRSRVENVHADRQRVRDLVVSQGRRQRREPDERRQRPGARAAGAGHPEQRAGRGVRARRTLPVVRPPPRRLRLQPGPAGVGARHLRPANRQGVQPDRSVRQRDASRALPGRQVAGVCDALRRGNGPAAAQPDVGRRALARLPGAARRPGVALHPRPDAGSSFTPDSKALVVSYGGKIWRVEVPSGQATPIPFTVKVHQDLGPVVRFETRVDTGDVLVKQIRDASPSPDGSRLAFSALDKLYVMDLPGGTPRRLTTDSVHEQVPAWSPDGQWIAYVTWTDQGGSIQKIRPDGRGKAQRLTPEPAFYDHPVWSPDGQRIVVIKGPRGPRVAEHFGPGYELDWLPAAGGAPTRITPIAGGGRPHFSRDPNRVYIYEANEGLVSMRYDGTDRRVHIKVTGLTPNFAPNPEPFPADEVLIAPDSGRVLATSSNYVYLVTLPLVGATPPAINVADTAAAAFPVHRLTRVGGDFIGWTPDGKTVYWSVGRSFFRYSPAEGESLAKAKARADSIRADSLKQATKEKPDSVGKARVDSLAKLPAYEGERADITIRVPRDVPRGSVVLRGARIVSMKGDELIEKGDVLVTDNRIGCVAATCAAPAGARVIDVAGETIIPGLIDIHAHPWPTWGIHETEVWKYAANLAGGVTTTRDPQTSTTDVLTYADQVETGELLGPRIYHTGPGVFGAFLEENWTSLDDVRNTLKRYSEFYHTNTIKQYMAGNRKQRQWVIMAAKELGLMPTIEGGLDFKMNQTVQLDGYPGSEHAFPIMPLYQDAVQLAAQSGITYTPTLLVSYGGPFSENYFYERFDIHENAKIRRFIPHEEIDQRAERRPWFRENQYVFPRIAASAAAVLRAGGNVGMGCHGQLDGLGCHWELWAMVGGGMTPREALRVGTMDGAYGIGMDKDLGSLEPGKLADLIVLDASPLEDIHNTEKIRYVMKNGRLYEGETLNEVWPRAKPLPQMWWWEQEPKGVK